MAIEGSCHLHDGRKKNRDEKKNRGESMCESGNYGALTLNRALSHCETWEAPTGRSTTQGTASEGAAAQQAHFDFFKSSMSSQVPSIVIIAESDATHVQPVTFDTSALCTAAGTDLLSSSCQIVFRFS